MRRLHQLARRKSITHNHIADLVAGLEERGLAPKSIANYAGTLSALVSFAGEPRRGWVTSNPCRGAVLPAMPDCSEIRFLVLAAAGVPMRTLQEWMGHRISRRPSALRTMRRVPERLELVAAAFGHGTSRGTSMSESDVTSEHLNPVNTGVPA